MQQGERAGNEEEELAALQLYYKVSCFVKSFWLEMVRIQALAASWFLKYNTGGQAETAFHCVHYDAA